MRGSERPKAIRRLPKQEKAESLIMRRKRVSASSSVRPRLDLLSEPRRSDVPRDFVGVRLLAKQGKRRQKEEIISEKKTLCQANTRFSLSSCCEPLIATASLNASQTSRKWGVLMRAMLLSGCERSFQITAPNRRLEHQQRLEIHVSLQSIPISMYIERNDYL